jgi:cobalt-zinc-cadmium efflux system protein
MAHSHTVDYNKSFLIGILLNVMFIAVELFYGFAANSSALLADAGHNAGDVLGLVFAWFAFWLATKKPTKRLSYGYKKSTILISLVNALLLFVAVGIIAWEAIQKFKSPQPVAGNTVMLVAGVGFVINALTALLFMKGQKEDLNLKGAFLHMAADAAVSLGVVLAGLFIRITGIDWIDPLMSLIIVVIILWGTWQLFIEGVNLALDGIPRHIDMDQIINILMRQKGVVAYHDLHVWAISTSENALSVHLQTNGENSSQLLEDLKEQFKEEVGLSHLTIQVEMTNNGLNCRPCSE